MEHFRTRLDSGGSDDEVINTLLRNTADLSRREHPAGIPHNAFGTHVAERGYFQGEHGRGHGLSALSLSAVHPPAQGLIPMSQRSHPPPRTWDLQDWMVQTSRSHPGSYTASHTQEDKLQISGRPSPGDHTDYWSWHNEAVKEDTSGPQHHLSTDTLALEEGENNAYWAWHNSAITKAKHEKRGIDRHVDQRKKEDPHPNGAHVGHVREIKKAEPVSHGHHGYSEQEEAHGHSEHKETHGHSEHEAIVLHKSDKEESSKPGGMDAKGCVRALCGFGCVLLVVLMILAVVHDVMLNSASEDEDNFSDPDYAQAHFLSCMQKLESPSHGTCSTSCLREVVEGGFTGWQMQCVSEEDRSTLEQQQMLACDCQDLVPGYLENAQTCCHGDVSLLSEAVQRFCGGPKSFKPKLEGIFKRYCQLDNIPDYAEVKDPVSVVPVLSIALMGSLMAGMAVAGLVAVYLRKLSARRRDREDPMPYQNLSG